MAFRSLNCCGECGYSWYPRGKSLSHRCPRCGSQSTDFADSGEYTSSSESGFQVPIGLYVIGGVLGFFMMVTGRYDLPFKIVQGGMDFSGGVYEGLTAPGPKAYNSVEEYISDHPN